MFDNNLAPDTKEAAFGKKLQALACQPAGVGGVDKYPMKATRPFAESLEVAPCIGSMNLGRLAKSQRLNVLP
jgi:hypothetical protein